MINIILPTIVWEFTLDGSYWSKTSYYPDVVKIEVIDSDPSDQ